jgi:uracil-DNA glycosylase family 4
VSGIDHGAWEDLTREILDCERCPRLRAHCRAVAREKRRAYRDWTYHGRPVPGFGDPLARLVLVGLAPGAHGSNRTGSMFTGDASGDFLYAALHRLGRANLVRAVSRDDGLALSGIYITAVARCAPPANKPAPKEIAACRPFLLRELDLLGGARAFLALGGIAWQGLRVIARDRYGIREPQPAFGHGVVWRPSAGRPAFVAAYHPSQQNTQTGRLTASMFDQVLRTAWLLAGDGAR